ncbi:DM13 domain-containing protein [Vibrio jasicida]|uniref:DM13 domain-containing protein n=1 Tax=Vibrio jasicida TaxID=766224 RepID=UPI0005ED626B|nr:DM13 domain-containing protein [Vibrio jasicida]
MKRTLLLASHALCVLVGFAAGVYALPILIQPTSPDISAVSKGADGILYHGTFERNRADSDFLHWGEGSIWLTENTLAFEGKLAPGPDYKVYLSPTFIETEADFQRLKSQMINVGDVKTFDRFVVAFPADLPLDNYSSVIVWCETFGEFITSAQLESVANLNQN